MGEGVWEVVGGARGGVCEGVARARAAHPSSNSFVLVLGTQTRRVTSSSELTRSFAGLTTSVSAFTCRLPCVFRLAPSIAPFSVFSSVVFAFSSSSRPPIRPATVSQSSRSGVLIWNFVSSHSQWPPIT